MLRSDSLNNTALRGVARELSAFVPRFLFKRRKGQLRIGATLKLVTLSVRHTKDGQLIGRTRFAGHWAHLLQIDDKYIGFAVSTPVGPGSGDWMIEQVTVAPVVRELVNCLLWMEGNISQDGIIRFMPLPAWHSYAFVVELKKGEPLVILAHRPTSLRSLPVRRLNTWSAFLQKLAAEETVGPRPIKRKPAT